MAALFLQASTFIKARTIKRRPLSSHIAELKMVAVAFCCIIVGVLHPLSTEYSKTAVVSVGNLGATRNVMPFHPVTLTIAAEIISVVIAATIMILTESTLKASFTKMLDIQAWLPLLPVGIIYGLGDFLQTAACNVASSHVVLVVGQSKVLLTALISAMLLKRTTRTNWFWLILIFVAATVSAELSAESSPARSLELQGAALSFTKAALSSTGAVVSEALYKKGCADFWEVSFRIQFLMMLTSILLLPWTYGSFQILDPTEFFFRWSKSSLSFGGRKYVRNKEGLGYLHSASCTSYRFEWSRNRTNSDASVSGLKSSLQRCRIWSLLPLLCHRWLQTV